MKNPYGGFGERALAVVWSQGFEAGKNAHRHHRTLNGYSLLPWPRVIGRPVTPTNLVMEEALGLTTVIVGSCLKGYYVKPGREKAAESAIGAVDWARVEVIRELEAFVTERRFQRLCRACMKAVSPERFRIEMQRAESAKKAS